MKFRKFGRITLALAASLLIGFGTQSCHYDYTEAYIIVTGSQYNQVASYREDNETGVLHAAPHDPLSSGGSNPIRAQLLTGGRYVYVLNQGKPTTAADGTITWTGANVSLFSIGGDGGMAFQLSYPSQGFGSLRLALSTGGTFLYVLDEYQPGTTPSTTAASPSISAATPCYDSASGVYRPAGDVTVYSIDSSTGRLFLLQNQQQQTAQGSPLSYFPIGCFPIDFHLASELPLHRRGQRSRYRQHPGGLRLYRQPPPASSSRFQGGAQPITGAQNISVIGGSANGSWIYILDSGANMIYSFTQGGNGLLSAITGGAFPNFSGAAGMSALTTDSGSKFLYVANTQSPGLNQSGSVISAFNITGNTGDLTTLPPGYFGTGSSPVCIFEDPSHQYLYTADAGSSTVTGSLIDPNTGILSNLRKGSTFATVGTPTWCLYSSNLD